VTPVRQHSGFTLLEVMLAVFILGFGLLALHAVQLKIYALAQDGEYQSLVAQEAVNLAESWRAQLALSPREEGLTQSQAAALLASAKRRLAGAMPQAQAIEVTLCPAPATYPPAASGALSCSGAAPLTVNISWRIRGRTGTYRFPISP
jgi:type IV pilus modification protein PilV